MAMAFSRPDNGLLVGTNIYGVIQFVLQGSVVVTNTRMMERIAFGTLDAYGDARSMDGHCINVDILLTTAAQHLVDVIAQLMQTLLRQLQARPDG